MKIVSVAANSLLLIVAAISALKPVLANELPEATPIGQAYEEQAYHQAIMKLEARQGAYAGELSETLQGLARMLQQQGRHEEAIEVFQRGVHLTRINDGLYSSQQIPLLQGEILSYLARGNFPLADERQTYLYRVQLHSLKNTDEMVDALMAQGRWQLQAYQLGLGGAESYTRLMQMLDLYHMAMEDVMAREGDGSPNLLPPLHGMLEAQYLISGYDIGSSQPVFDEDGRPNSSLLQFKSYQARSYKQGHAIIAAIAEIEKETNTSTPPAQTMVMLGDWSLWNGRSDEAWEAYRAAEAELARDDDAQVSAEDIFGEPVALPDIASLNPLPAVVAPTQGDVLLAFSVSKRGQVRDLERVDERELEGKGAARLMRKLRRTPFRPRIEAGQPVETENIVKAFDIQ